MASGTRSQLWPASRSIAAQTPPDLETRSQVVGAHAKAALQDHHARVLARGVVELGEAPGCDRAPEPRADDADVDALRHKLTRRLLVSRPKTLPSARASVVFLVLPTRRRRGI